MRIRTLYQQLFMALMILMLVAIALMILGYKFHQVQPLRDHQVFDRYNGEVTYCRTLNHYLAKADERRVGKLLKISDSNAMNFILWRFGKEKGGMMVRACAQAQKQHVLERCEAEPALAIEQVILEYNRPTLVAQRFI